MFKFRRKVKQNKDSIIAKLLEDCSNKDSDIQHLESVVVRLNSRINTAARFADNQSDNPAIVTAQDYCPNCKVAINISITPANNFTMYH
jgi:hypothetical protein